MKKLMYGGAVLMLMVGAFSLMSLKSVNKVHAKHKKPTTITFTIYNTSASQNVSWSFHTAAGNIGGVANHGTTTPVVLNADTYTVALNNAGQPISFHMLFNTGENAFAPGHVFNGIVVGTGHSTSLSLY
jgi:hypothetical protein